MNAGPDSLEVVAMQATRDFRARRFPEAAAGYERCVAMSPGSPALHFNLATARESQGDLPGAIRAYLDAWRLDPKEARIALFAGAALEAAGRREDAVTMFSWGDDLDLAVRRAKDDPALDPEIRRRSALADRVMRAHFTQLHAAAMDEFERRASESGGTDARPELSRVRSAIWVQTHDQPFTYRTPDQRPDLFYVPALPARAITPRGEFAWAAAVEACTQTIREEYLAAVQSGAQLSPYVEARTPSPIWRELRGKADWSSLHLYKAAQETPYAPQFPRTMAALAAADIVRIDGRPMELFFSRLRPGAHIPPHFGVANSRVTLHLPLIVPAGCSIRVGQAMHEWREGELFAFDDSFEHEAWNRGSGDRVVLIFEAHHPDLHPAERAAIQHAFAARGRWLRERRVPT